MSPAFMTATPEQQNPWDKVSIVAKKLGVEPCAPGTKTGITARGSDGKSYDLMEIVLAVLDKIDKAAGPLPPFDEALSDLLKKYENIISDDLIEILETALIEFDEAKVRGK